MKEKKNIDRLFQEKFKNFEAHPSDQVWKNIVKAKKENEDRKIAPIWWRLGGVAAVALILVTTSILLWNNTTELHNTTPELVQSDKEEDSNRIKNSGVVSTSGIDHIISEKTKSGLVLDNTTTDGSNEQASDSETIKTKDNFLFGVNNTQDIVNQSDKTMTDQKISNKEKTNQVTINKTSTSQSIVSDVTKVDVKKGVKEDTPQKRSNLIDPTVTIDKRVEDASIAIVEKKTDTSQNHNKQEENKKSLVDEAVRIADTNAQDIDIKEAITRRWDVGAIAAPVYSGDFGGSGIDPQFKDNTKTSDLNLSYGVQISYAVTPKFKVRTGVSNVDLNYNTQDISFTTSNNAQALIGIDFSQNASFLNITDRVNPSTTVLNPNDEGLAQGSNTFSNGEIQQNVGYVEIPMEAVYVLSDKKLGIELIGGVSTLVLNNNEVFLESNGLLTNLGTSNALNDISFTTNLGLGLNYKVAENVKINIEPSLKYQLNAYNNNVGEFKPYYVGLYTGVNYRF